MNLNEYCQYDALGLAQLVQRGEVSAKELAQVAMEGIHKVNPELNAIVDTYPEAVDELDESQLGTGPFKGVPFLMKDGGSTMEGRRQTIGCRLFENHIAAFDSTLTTRFKQAGLNILASTTCPEMGFTWTTESTLHGKTRNPWNPERIAGGSSGGSGALVAAGAVPIAHANDGGGSTRLPASVNGLVGLKCSRGRVSRGVDGDDLMIPVISELVVSRTVRDTAAILDAVEGPEPGEGFPVARPQRPYIDELNESGEVLRIALATDHWGPYKADPVVKASLEGVAAQLQDMGHVVVEAGPPIDFDAFFANFTRMFQMPAKGLIDYFGLTTGLHATEETLDPIMWKVYQSSSQMTAADNFFCLAANAMVTRQLGEFFRHYDLILTPTQAIPTPPLGIYDTNHPELELEEWFGKMWQAIPYTPLNNATGTPAISLPLCHTPDGMPLGAQFMAPIGEEARLIRIAAALEKACPWIDRKPDIHVAS